MASNDATAFPRSFRSSFEKRGTAGEMKEGWGSERTDGEGGEVCSYSTVESVSCRLVEGEGGKPVRECERTWQRLRQCGRGPTEVVESRTEHTQTDASSMAPQWESQAGGWTLAPQLPGTPLDSHWFKVFGHGGGDGHPSAEGSGFLSSWPFQGRETSPGSGFGGFEDFLHAAEGLAEEVLEKFGFHRDSSGLHRDGDASQGVEGAGGYGARRERGERIANGEEIAHGENPSGRWKEKLLGRRKKQNDYTDYAKDFEEV